MPAGFDPLNIVLIAVFVVLIFFMFRNSRRNKAKQEELKAQIVPGVEVMTNFGLFGTLVSIDEVSNVAELEVTPGTIVKVHRQTIAKVVTNDVAEGEPRSVEEAMEIANREYEAAQKDAAEPEFGERVDAAEAEPVAEPAAAEEPVKKPVRRTAAKKASE
jgi:preprotein translocase subunit YajC